MLIIPLRAIPNQAVTFAVGQANIQCQVNVYQKITGMFLDLYVSNVLTISAILCRNLTPLVINSYFGFPGDLAFCDTTGLNADPVYTGLGTRWFLFYINNSDVEVLDLNPVF